MNVDAEGIIFGEGRMPAPVRKQAPDTQAIREWPGRLLKTLRASGPMPRAEKDLRMWRTVLPNMPKWLPDDEHPCLGSSPDPAFSGGRDRGFPQPVHIPAAVRAGAGGPAARARPDGWFPSGPGGPPGGAARPGVRRRPPTCPPRCAGRGAAHSR